ncbi:MAG: RNA polymerase subunit sigma, partial [Muribaculaceae bacterium]|nr:RNA polymerase subunit sigma [Muribaculaceae bacterium]
MKSTLPTRRSEISFYTSDPATMLYKYIAEDVSKEWTQQVTDTDTGEITEIARSERLFNRGTFIDQNTLE